MSCRCVAPLVLLGDRAHLRRKINKEYDTPLVLAARLLLFVLCLLYFIIVITFLSLTLSCDTLFTAAGLASSHSLTEYTHLYHFSQQLLLFQAIFYKQNACLYRRSLHRLSACSICLGCADYIPCKERPPS
jgi:hypothetical protein